VFSPWCENAKTNRTYGFSYTSETEMTNFIYFMDYLFLLLMISVFNILLRLNWRKCAIILTKLGVSWVINCHQILKMSYRNRTKETLGKVCQFLCKKLMSCHYKKKKTTYVMPKKTQFSLVFFFLFRMDQFNKLHWFEMLKIRYKSQRSSCHELRHT
jgi:hypothetical protein